MSKITKMNTNYMHNNCEVIAMNRILKTTKGKYVFDTLYNNTIVISDGIEYDTMKEAQTALNKMLEKIQNHETTNAIIC